MKDTEDQFNETTKPPSTSCELPTREFSTLKQTRSIRCVCARLAGNHELVCTVSVCRRGFCLRLCSMIVFAQSEGERAQCLARSRSLQPPAPSSSLSRSPYLAPSLSLSAYLSLYLTLSLTLSSFLSLSAPRSLSLTLSLTRSLSLSQSLSLPLSRSLSLSLSRSR